MMTDNIETYIEVCEDLGWTVDEYYNDEIRLGQYSPAGEDFSFSVSAKNFVNDLISYYEGFDVEEHVAMWLNAKIRKEAGNVPDIHILIEDADYIQENMLRPLVFAIKEKECELSE